MVASAQLDAVRQLTNLADINRLLHEANARERSIDADLERLLSLRSTIEQDLVDLEEATKEALQVARADAEQLAASAADTAELAGRVSRKVRQLDAAQGGAAAALARVDAVVSRMAAVDGAAAALATDDLEAAAGCVARFLELQDEGEAPPAPADTSPAAQQARALLETKAALEAAVRERGAAAARARDHAAVLRYVRLSAPLRRQREGLGLLLGFLRRLLAERAAADYNALVDSFAAGEGARPDYVGTLTGLLRDTVGAVDEHAALLREVFDPELRLEALRGLHAEVDDAGARLLQRYADYRKLGRLAAAVGGRRRGGAADGPPPVEPKQVESFLEELLALCGTSEEYLSYLLLALGDAAAPDPLPPAAETALRGGPFSTAVRELLGYYIALEEYYMEESVSKAIRIDEAAPGALTSSVADDAFFVLLKAGRRAMATGKAPSVVAILNQAVLLLGSLYRDALVSRLHGAPARLAAAANAGDGAPPGAAAEAAAVALNTAAVSADHVAKLRTSLEAAAAALFAGSPSDRDRIKMVLDDLTKTASDFRASSARSADALAAALLPALRPVVDGVAAEDYELATGAGAEGSGWPRALLAALSSRLGWLSRSLLPEVYDSVVGGLLDRVVQRLEAVLAQKRFTQLGGLALERDVRLLLGGASELTSRPVRDKLARLTQVATLLGAEDVAEVRELWGDGGGGGLVTWQLGEADVRSVLRQRTDLAYEEVARLRLA